MGSQTANIHTDKADLTSLRNKSTIITGGASGLGKANTLAWAAAGAYVTIADVQDSLGEALAKEITSKGGKASYVHCDVTNYESSVKAFKHAVNFSESKTLDYAVLYAGVIGNAKNLVELVEVNEKVSLDEDPVKPTYTALEVNLTGIYISAYLAMHYMRLPGSSASNGAATTNGASSADKCIVFIASLAGYTDYPNNSAYGASKFGVRGLWRGVRHHTPRLSIRTNLVAPWFVHTPMTQFMKDGLDAAGVKDGQGFTWATADYVVEAVGYAVTGSGDGGKRLDGRALAVVPEGYADLEDDLEKGHGGGVLLDLISRRLEAGDQLA